MYKAALDKCNNFIVSVLHQQPTLPLAPHQLHLYVAYLHSLNYKHATIVSHMSAISHYHKINQHPDPVNIYPTIKLLTGVRNSQIAQPDHRKPVTRSILQGLISVLPYCASSQYDIHLYHAMYTAMYYACLRASEVLHTDTPHHNIQCANITIHSDGQSVNIHMSSYKHASNQQADILLTATQSPDCPVQSLQNYLARRPPLPGAFFLNTNHHPVQRAAFMHTFTACLRYLNLVPAHYNVHSFRIGRTTDMAEQQVPQDIIQRIGRWKSNAFTKYIRPQPVPAQPKSSNSLSQ